MSLHSQFKQLRRNGVIREWSTGYRRFREKHEDWLENQGNAPVYLLPREVINALAAGGFGREPLLGASGVEIEVEFMELCRGFDRSVVGAWNGRPIRFDLLAAGTATAAQFQEGIVQLKQQTAQKAGQQLDKEAEAQSRIEAKQIADKVNETNHQILGYAGWLVCNPDFCKDRDRIKAAWSSTKQPFDFPLTVGELYPQGSPPPQKDREQLVMDLRAFYTRWQLARLATWDLPEPQGPMMAPAGAAPLFPGGGVAIVLPTFFDIRNNQAFHNDVVDQQYRLARHLGQSPPHPLTDISPTRMGKRKANPHEESEFLPSQWETAFRLMFIERTLVSRYGQRRGLVTRMTVGMERWLAGLGQHIGQKRIEQIRGLYRKHLKQRPSTLQPL